MQKYRGILMCADCSHEYRKIFDGYLPKNNPFNQALESFKKGWEKAEEEGALPHIEVPECIIDLLRGYFGISENP